MKEEIKAPEVVKKPTPVAKIDPKIVKMSQQKDLMEAASVSGVLTSNPISRNVRIEQMSISLYGKQMFTDTVLELKYGQRYGLIGSNGSGMYIVVIYNV